MFDEKKKRVFVRGSNNKAIVKSEHEYYDEYEGYLEESEFGRPAVIKAIA
jgi:hypothetical protein